MYSSAWQILIRMDLLHLMNLVQCLVRDGLVFQIKYPLSTRQTKFYYKIIFIFIDLWSPYIASSIGHKKEYFFEEMDKDNDKMIMPNEFDRDLK